MWIFNEDAVLPFCSLQFFTHPVVHEEMNRKWHGRNFSKTKWKWWQKLLFGILCFFDLVLLSPTMYLVSLLKKKKKKKKKEKEEERKRESEY